MNMGVPETLTLPAVEENALNGQMSPKEEKRPDIVVTGEYAPINMKNHKRRRNSVIEPVGKPFKRSRTERLQQTSSQRLIQTSHTTEMPMDFQLSTAQRKNSTDIEISARAKAHFDSISNPSLTPEHSVPHGLRHTNLRDVLQYLVNDLLKVGGRPESAIAHDTEHGEEIEVRVRSSSGEEKVKLVQWSVDPSVPETIVIDEKDLAKMISCVFLNAVKFTEQGHITLTARLSPKLRYIVINVRDTGPGIPDAFLPNLFKPFSKEDDSTTRHSEGLGLGLLVAKGLARKLGGDLTCIRADTSGTNRGTEFEMRVPCTPSDTVSRPSTPFSSPTPSHRSLHSADLDSMGPAPFDPLAPLHNHHPHHHQHHPISNIESPPPGYHSSRQNYRSRNTRKSSPSPIIANLPTTTGTKGTAPPPSAAPAAPLAHSPPLGLSDVEFDRHLASKYPLNFLVVEDNKINRRILVSMLNKLGYEHVLEAYDGSDAVRTMEKLIGKGTVDGVQEKVDVVLMDLWMPFMDGYEATERILSMKYGPVGEKEEEEEDGVDHGRVIRGPPTILAVTADVTDEALKRAEEVGMKGFLSKPYKLRDLQKLILEYCARLPTSLVSGLR
jgi:CheY-like chemotaxis protein